MKYSYLGADGFGTYEVDWPTASFTRVDGQPEALLVPGFVDIHIHGAFGIDFMSASEHEMVTLCHKLADVGYEAFLPTTITASADAVAKAISNLPDHPLIAGFHLEGPFISPEYPGAQPIEFIAVTLRMDVEWEEVLKDPRLRVITLAPEKPGALPLIERLNEAGVIVSIGHTNATFVESKEGFQSGARHATHTFNAMRPFHHREAGAAGFVLSEDDLAAELIYDRIHVSREAAALLIKSKPEDKIIAVSDSSMATGLKPGKNIQMWGHDCLVGQGEVRLKTGALAGSAITLLDAFRNLAEDFGLELAVRACCLNPRNAIRMQPEPSVYMEMDRNLQVMDIRRP
jgi:N-acetylglucosamine-6-phosphate deacetylase